MGLTQLDSNKYASIPGAKLDISSITTYPDNNTSNPSSSINEYGEIEIKQLSQPQKRLSEEAAGIANAYTTGQTTYQLAKQYGAHRTTVSHALKKIGVTPDKRSVQKKLGKEKVIEIPTPAGRASPHGIPFFIRPDGLPYFFAHCGTEKPALLSESGSSWYHAKFGRWIQSMKTYPTAPPSGFPPQKAGREFYSRS